MAWIEKKLSLMCFGKVWISDCLTIQNQTQDFWHWRLCCCCWQQTFCGNGSMFERL